MKKFVSTVKGYALKLAVAPVALVAGTQAAHAGPVGDIVRNFTEDVKEFGNLFVYGTMAGGAYFLGAGFLKLREASQSQGQQVKYGEGMWRVGLGICMLSVGGVLAIGRETLGVGSGEKMEFEGF